MQHRRPQHPPHQDLARIERILDGSTADWQRLVEDHAGIATAVVRRRLRDEDAARDVVVEVFERLYEGLLGAYSGESSFKTWFLIVVSKAAVDWVRREHGRTRLPVAIARRPELDRRLFELFFIRGWPSQVVLSRIQSQGFLLDRDRFWSLLEEMDGLLDRRSRRRLRFEREARREGGTSARWLEFVDHRIQERELQDDPELRDADADIAARVGQVQRELARLTRDERRALELRYRDELTAREIAVAMELTGTRQAFTILNRAKRRLRLALALADPPPVGLEGKP